MAKTQGGPPDIKAPTSVSPEIILADPTKNYSRFLATEQNADDPFVQWLAWDMSKDGNKEPVKVMRRAGDNKYPLDLVSGFNRHAAAMLIVGGFTYHNPLDDKDYKVHNPDFKLRVIVSTGNDRDRARENLRENAARKDLTHMDLAHQVRYCEDVLGLTVNETAEWLGMKDASYVSQIRKLLILPREIQIAVAKGLIKPSIRVLMKLTELAPEEREPFFQSILDGEKVTLDDVRKHIVEKYDAETGDDAETPGEGSNGSPGKGGGKTKKAAPQTMQLSMKLLRDFYGERTGPGEYTPIGSYCKWMVNTRLKGKATPQKHENQMYKIVRRTLEDVITHLTREGLLEDDFDVDTFYKQLIANQANLGDTADEDLETANA